MDIDMHINQRALRFHGLFVAHGKMKQCQQQGRHGYRYVHINQRALRFHGLYVAHDKMKTGVGGRSSEIIFYRLLER